MAARHKVIFLDRDGVLNRLVVEPEQGTLHSPLHPTQVEILPGVPEALRELKELGYWLVVVSNQPAAAKGQTTLGNLEAVHARVLRECAQAGGQIDHSEICFHTASQRCTCRKPAPGLLQNAARALGMRGKSWREDSWMVGDGITDIEAGRRFGVHCAFIGPHRCDACKWTLDAALVPDVWVGHLPEFSQRLSSPMGYPPQIDDQLSSAYTLPSQTESFSQKYLREATQIIKSLDSTAIENLASGLAQVRARGGRLFICGVGGSAGHASHAVSDFRKLAQFEAYCPTDNVSEFTARANDEGWETTLSEWLQVSRLSAADGVLIFSVGGGDQAKNVSVNLVRALEFARSRKCTIFGVVGRQGGYTAKVADVLVVIPTLAPSRITPHTEGLTAVVWHLLVSHPALQLKANKWETSIQVTPENQTAIEQTPLPPDLRSQWSREVQPNLLPPGGEL